MATESPHVLLGAGGGIIPTLEPEALTSLLKHIQTLPTPIYGIDTAASYPRINLGYSEKILGEAGIGNFDLIIDTKILVGPTVDSSNGGPLSKANFQKSFEKSLANLKVGKVRAIYAHQADTSTPAAEAVAEFGAVLREGKAEIVSIHLTLFLPYSRLSNGSQWGISNFTPAQVAEYVAEAEKQGIPKPALYQGQYNAVIRGSEDELFPLLKQHGIKFYAYR
jgi:aflatoxin B1 aldehyde reductase